MSFSSPTRVDSGAASSNLLPSAFMGEAEEGVEGVEEAAAAVFILVMVQKTFTWITCRHRSHGFR